MGGHSFQSKYDRMFILGSFDREAAGIYYIPWPDKKLLPKILTQVCLPETAQNCAACSQLAKAAKKMNFKQTYATSVHRK